MSNESLNIVWFKRDLRLLDHPALAAACDSGGPTLTLFCLEPDWVSDPHTADRHGRFLAESLADVSAQLKQRGHRLWVFQCDALSLFRTLLDTFYVKTVFSHEEVGLTWTWRRDRAVAELLHSRGVAWEETLQAAVQRGQRGRQGWKRFADAFLAAPMALPDINRLRPVDITTKPALDVMRCRSLPKTWLTTTPDFQQGGETRALERMEAFLHHDGWQYRGNIGKPDQSRHTGSRLSAYLAFGNLSIRQVAQSVRASALPSGHRRAIYSRLRWHCHFIQKFESATRIEFEPLNPAYQPLINAMGAADDTERSPLFDAWKNGQTGYPLVDACMRALHRTGFLNFRMRAMLVSVACHHLGLHWQPVARHLGRLFLDFEPGIHYPQIHMQAGHTGFNTVRVYNPLQQSLKQDPEGRFILEHVPELAPLASAGQLLHQPWELTPMEAVMLGFSVPGNYPERCFDHELTGRQARDRLWNWRKRQDVKARVPELLDNQTEKAPAR